MFLCSQLLLMALNFISMESAPKCHTGKDTAFLTLKNILLILNYPCSPSASRLHPSSADWDLCVCVDMFGLRDFWKQIHLSPLTGL